MIVYLVEIIDFGNGVQQTYTDSVWINMTNAQCQVDSLNNDFDQHYPESDSFAKMKQMKVQDYEVGRDVL